MKGLCTVIAAAANPCLKVRHASTIEHEVKVAKIMPVLLPTTAVAKRLGCVTFAYGRIDTMAGFERCAMTFANLQCLYGLTLRSTISPRPPPSWNSDQFTVEIILPRSLLLSTRKISILLDKKYFLLHKASYNINFTS